MQSPILVLLSLLTVQQHLPIIEKENLETHKKKLSDFSKKKCEIAVSQMSFLPFKLVRLGVLLWGNEIR